MLLRLPNLRLNRSHLFCPNLLVDVGLAMGRRSSWHQDTAESMTQTTSGNRLTFQNICKARKHLQEPPDSDVVSEESCQTLHTSVNKEHRHRWHVTKQCRKGATCSGRSCGCCGTRKSSTLEGSTSLLDEALQPETLKSPFSCCPESAWGAGCWISLASASGPGHPDPARLAMKRATQAWTHGRCHRSACTSRKVFRTKMR